MFRKVLLFVVLSIFSSHCVHADVYDSLSKLPLNEKITQVKKIFSDKVHHLDSATAVTELTKALHAADNNSDYELKAITELYLAQYYDFKGSNPGLTLRYYTTAIKTASNHDITLLLIESTHKLGVYYYKTQKYPLAFENMLSANEMAQSFGYEKIPDIGKYLYDIGERYYNFQDFSKAIVFLKQSLKYPFNLERTPIQIPNTLALSYRSLGEIDSSYYYFQQALIQAIKYKDTAWIGIANGNMGNIHLLRKEYDKALPLIDYDYRISQHYHESGSVANCLIGLSQIALAKNDITSSERYLDSAKLLLGKTGNLSTLQNLYKNFSVLYAHKNSMSKAYAYLDTFVMFKDSLAKRNDKTMVSKVEAKIETEKHLAALKLLESKRKTSIILRNSIVITLSLALIIVFQVLYRMRLRSIKNKEIFEIEKRRAEEEIRNSEKLLLSYIESLKEKSQLIEDFKAEISRLQSLPNGPVQQEQQEIYEKLHHATILTENDWLEFKTLFMKVHKDFFARLAEKYPDLTQGETRFLALTKLGLSVSEMANMLGISPDSVRKLRLRLRKKLNLEEHAVLEEIFPK